MKIVGRKEIFKKDDIIFREGEYGHKMYIILNGIVDIVKKEAEGGYTVTILESGDFFGEMSVIRGNKRIATAKAKSDVECRSLNTGDLKILLTYNSSISIKLIKELCDRIEANIIKIENLTMFSQIQQIVIYLVNIATKEGTQIFKPLVIPYVQLVEQLAHHLKLIEERIDRILVNLSKANRLDIYQKKDEYYIEISTKIFREEY